MKTFEGFIESDAFFPILIILLILLVSVFVWIVITNKKEERMKREKRLRIIDESAEIKIIDNNHRNVELKSIEDTVLNDFEDDEPERNEIAIVEVSSNSSNQDKKNNRNDNSKKNNKHNKNYKKEDEHKQDENQRDNEFKKVAVETGEEKDDEAIKVPGLFAEEVADIDNVEVHLNPEDNLPKPEVELPMPKEVEEEEPKVEEPVMTEEEKAIEAAFALPDFENILDDDKIEDEIIEAANKYIAEIMNKEDD